MVSIKVTLGEEAQSLIAAAAKDNSRPVLQCLCIRDGKAIAANGFLIAYTDVKAEGEGELLIPVAVITALQEATKFQSTPLHEGRLEFQAKYAPERGEKRVAKLIRIPGL